MNAMHEIGVDGRCVQCGRTIGSAGAVATLCPGPPRVIESNAVGTRFTWTHANNTKK